MKDSIDEKVFIIYQETTSSDHNYYGNIPKWNMLNAFIAKIPDFEFIINDEKANNLLMNANKDFGVYSLIRAKKIQILIKQPANQLHLYLIW